MWVIRCPRGNSPPTFGVRPLKGDVSAPSSYHTPTLKSNSTPFTANTPCSPPFAHSMCHFRVSSRYPPPLAMRHPLEEAVMLRGGWSPHVTMTVNQKHKVAHVLLCFIMLLLLCCLFVMVLFLHAARSASA